MLSKLTLIPFIGIASLHLLLNTTVYPPIMEYQAISVLGKNLAKLDIPDYELTINASVTSPRGIYFYGNSMPSSDTTKTTEYMIFLSDRTDLIARYTIIDSSYNLHISKLTLKFLNPATRDKKIQKVYLGKIRL